MLSEQVDYLYDITNSTSTTSTIQKAVQEITQQAQYSTPQEIEVALQRMNVLIREKKLLIAAIIALGCGALVERGANAESVADAIIQRMQEALELAPAFALACRDEARKHNDSGSGSEEASIEESVARYGEQLIEKMPQEARAWYATRPLCTAALAVMTRLARLRAEIRNRPELMTLIEQSTAYSSCALDLLELLAVLDDEKIVVLHPQLKRGYLIRISGISDNFQLHTLLADALIGNFDEGWLPGKRPDPQAVLVSRDGPIAATSEEDEETDTSISAEGSFNLWNWNGLQADGTLPSGYSGKEHWIWNEGKPADILAFEGTRMILLGPPPYPRSWNAGRYFPGLKGEVTVLEQFSEAQVRDWLAQIVAAIQ